MHSGREPGGAELGEPAFDVDLDGAEEVDVPAGGARDVGQAPLVLPLPLPLPIPTCDTLRVIAPPTR